MNNVIELKFGTPTAISYKDPKYGQIKFYVRGIFKCTPLNDQVNQQELQNMLNANADVWIREAVSKNDNVDYLVLGEKIKNHLLQKLTSEITVNNVNPIGIDNFELNLDEESMAIVKKNTVTIVQTDVGVSNGQTKCPKCGSTEITPVGSGGKLKCNFCRHEFDAQKVEGLDGDITKLEGQVIGSGAQDIQADFDNMVTLKCSSCGAEVVIDTSEVTHARCHWCRNTLSINQQIPNGSVPDVVLPFFISKEDARKEIEAFVNKRQFYAHPKFKQEFTTENILGVYFPYMIVDVNAHCSLVGQGEHLVRSYTVKVNDSSRTYYDADLYNVEREFDIAIDDLTIESSADKLNKNVSNKTNNVINAIMPFDLMNAVKWDANYLRGYSSEKRDLNIDQLKPFAEIQSKDVARFAANESLEFYDRGVAWSSESIDIKGQQWKSAYLPVWLYSYQEDKGGSKLLHYVAVNGRTKEVMGSVPLHMPKLILVSLLIEVLAFIAMMFIDFEYNYIFLAAGIIYFFVIYGKYRNKDARHRHELETRRKVTNLRQVDNFYQSKKRLSNSRMSGANNTYVNGAQKSLDVVDHFINEKLK